MRQQPTNDSMTTSLLNIITADDAELRNASLDAICAKLSTEQLFAECSALDDFRRTCPNLYQRVRSLFFLYAIHRFILPERFPAGGRGSVPFEGYHHLLARRFEE